MKFIFSPDSFKGSLPSARSIELLTQAARETFPGCETVGIPMADGGEGTVDAILAAVGGTRCRCTVQGPLGEPVDASYGFLGDGTAVIEMSAASGLPLVPRERRDPTRTSTYGTGELIHDALERGATRLFVCVGGSATNDGGMGAMAALGARFLDARGEALSPVGGNLGLVETIDLCAFDTRIRKAELRVLCDVKNPLCGTQGATRVFGPQKGATEAQLDALEHGMAHYAALLEQVTGVPVAELPGAGAAGGLSAALCALCGGSLISGIEAVLSLVGFDEALADADLVVTGEGRMDSQSEKGKVVYGVGRHSKAHGVRAEAIVGGLAIPAEAARAYGIEAVYPLMRDGVTLEQAISEAEPLYLARARELFAAFRQRTT